MKGWWRPWGWQWGGRVIWGCVVECKIYVVKKEVERYYWWRGLRYNGYGRFDRWGLMVYLGTPKGILKGVVEI